MSFEFLNKNNNNRKRFSSESSLSFVVCHKIRLMDPRDPCDNKLYCQYEQFHQMGIDFICTILIVNKNVMRFDYIEKWPFKRFFSETKNRCQMIISSFWMRCHNIHGNRLNVHCVCITLREWDGLGVETPSPTKTWKKGRKTEKKTESDWPYSMATTQSFHGKQ